MITTLTKRELNRNKLQRVPLTYIEEAIQALIQKSALISIPLPKGAIQYLYIPITSELQFPTDNYREYVGSGTYQSGLMFYKMYTVVETGKSKIGITEDVLSDMIEKSEQDIEEMKVKEQKERELEEKGHIHPQKQKIITDTVDNYL